MLKIPLNENPENTHQAVLFHLKRKQEMSVSELCKALSITSMAVRRHLSGLQNEGLVESRIVKKEKGRPTYLYKLTNKAESLFPSAANSFADDLLEAVYESKGEEGVFELLSLKNDLLIRKLQPELAELVLSERVKAVVKIFSENGFMTDFANLENGNFFIFQQHCAIHSLAQKYKQICFLETNLLERLLGVKVTLTKHILNHDQICGYLVHQESN